MADETLTPVIVQDAATNRVLMLAYANGEAIRRTRETGEAWFWSRSRKELWHKGATSGNTMAVDEIADDCDGDALLYRVRPSGPACHTGAESCFAPWLWRIVAERAATRPEGSYVAALLDAGPAAAARKVGEEGVEAALAAVTESDERLVEELADLWFHSYVLLAARGLQPSAVEDEPAAATRHGIEHCRVDDVAAADAGGYDCRPSTRRAAAPGLKISSPFALRA
jgi:phosphoribosyl-ATP pyrophosphohydrolase/phosphoribosyl-AMP cyclohydrolase